MLIRYLILIAVSLILLTTLAAATEYRVDWTGAGDFVAIGPAVAFADSGDVITVAPGTYSGPNNRDINFMGKDLTLISEAGPQFTIIDLDRLGRAFIFTGGETYYSLIDGFTITKGRKDMGGALFVAGSSPVIHNCVFDDNLGDSFGGAIFIGVDSEAEVVECHFVDNRAANHGGAIYCLQSMPRIRWNTFERNSVDVGTGGAISCKEGSWASIASCEFRENTAGEFGGAVYCGMTGSPEGRVAAGPDRISGTVVKNSTFIENVAPRGGGVYINGFSEVLVDHNLFIRNVGTVAGGGLYAETSWEYAPTVLSCTFVYNDSPGGAIYSDGGEDYNHLTVQRCIIAFSTPDDGTGRPITREPGSWLETIHTMTYMNGGPGGSDALPNGYECFEGVDPLFCDVTSDYYFLCANSPALAENNEYGQYVGAYRSACGECNSPVQPITWGSLKALYR